MNKAQKTNETKCLRIMKKVKAKEHCNKNRIDQEKSSLSNLLLALGLIVFLRLIMHWKLSMVKLNLNIL